MLKNGNVLLFCARNGYCFEVVDVIG